MKSIDRFYSSVTDRWWFSGHPNLNEKQGFTWFIDSTGCHPYPGYWEMSVSAPGIAYVLPAGWNAVNYGRRKNQSLLPVN